MFEGKNSRLEIAQTNRHLIQTNSILVSTNSILVFPFAKGVSSAVEGKGGATEGVPKGMLILYTSLLGRPEGPTCHQPRAERRRSDTLGK